MTETELLFTEILSCDRLSLYQKRMQALDKDKLFYVSSVLKRRLNGEPIHYILGKAEFMGFEFKLTCDVLIPRPETEILVETVIRLAARSPSPSILDLGTGSGCIAVSLAKFLPAAKISASDISQKALDVAEYNAALNKVNGKIKFFNSDLFSFGLPQADCYDFIVSNPPYIPSQEIEKLQPEIQYEPRIALDGGNDGLDFYRRIAASAAQHLKQDGILFLEIGFGQLQNLKNIFQNQLNFEIIEVVKDYNNIDRVIVLQRILKNG